MIFGNICDVSFIHTLFLLLLAPPQFTDFPLDLEVEIGESILLTCSAEGNPAAQVTWAKQDEGPVEPSDTIELIDSPGANTVHIKVARPEDAGVYVCEARNPFGWVQAEILLSVTGLVPPRVAVAQSEVTVVEGHPVSLPCTITAGIPRPVQRWLKDSNTFQLQWRHSVDGEGALHIEPALHEDAGTYICELTNDVGSADHSFVLHVHVAPTIIAGPLEYITQEGRAVTLQCNTKGTPAPVVTWGKGESAATAELVLYNVNKDGSLEIPLPAVDDSGHYTCTATNQAGTISRTVRLLVQTKPRISVSGSHDLSAPIHVVAAMGSEIILPCEVAGNPLPVVSWRKDSFPLPIISASSLYFGESKFPTLL
uniref:Ig-like domain-containing protein n=1 Tax=Leptobrachium leishanense TaxID=445787 RepID=A0A8C5QE23_9ANUR